MKLAFLILAHNDEDNLIRLISRLTQQGDLVVVHWDKKNKRDIQKLAQDRLGSAALSDVRFSRRVAVDWGHWSMVEATLAAASELAVAGGHIDYVVLLSGADYPIRPLSELKMFLARHQGTEFIECVDPDVEPWVVQGLVKERYLHHHWFNWRNSPKLFSWSIELQKSVGYKRKLPLNLKPRFGSQWWALTWDTLKQVLTISQDKRVRKFFKTTWVPDEMFFQTVVASFLPKSRISGRSLTFYHFTLQGRPLTFYNDHYAFLTGQRFFFARKLSSSASQLRDMLDKHIEQQAPDSQPFRELGKQLGDYEHFLNLQKYGLPNRRVMGLQHDAWYGDLEWNRISYFVIVAPQGVKLDALKNKLNTVQNIRCYGEIYAHDHIAYDLPGNDHPFYPPDKVALRDQKRPNFLVDLLHLDPSSLTGFTLRYPLDGNNEMGEVVVYDQRASIIVLVSAENYSTESIDGNEHGFAFDSDLMSAYLYKVRKAWKTPLLVPYGDDGIDDDSIGKVVEYVSSLATRHHQQTWGG